MYIYNQYASVREIPYMEGFNFIRESAVLNPDVLILTIICYVFLHAFTRIVAYFKESLLSRKKKDVIWGKPEIRYWLCIDPFPSVLIRSNFLHV